MARSDQAAIRRVGWILGITAFVIAPALLLYAYHAQSSLRAYRQGGRMAQATVLDKGRAYMPRPVYLLQVSFWTAPPLEGGSLVIAEIRPVAPWDWQGLEVGAQVEVVYLPDDPEQAILHAALSPARRALAERYEFGLVVLVVGSLLVATAKRKSGVYLVGISLGAAVLVALAAGRVGHIGLVLAAFSLAWLGQEAWRLAEGRRSRAWPAITGTVVAAEVQVQRFKYRRIPATSLTYRYQVAGQMYAGQTTFLGPQGVPARVLPPAPQGPAVVVYYDPDHPERSRLRQGNGIGDYVAFAASLVTLLIGSVMMGLQFHWGW